MIKSLEKKEYFSGKHRGWDFRAWRIMVSEACQSRELIWRLFVRNFKAKYRQTFLGFVWALIMPLIAVGTFLLLNRAGIINIGEVAVPYPAYALLGLAIWHIFAGGLKACSNSVVAGGSMVVKINFPKEALVFSSMGEALVEVFVRLGLTVLVFVYYNVVPAWTVVFFPFALIPFLLFTLGLGLLLALLNAVFRDIANIVSLTSTFLLFITPVLYPEPQSGFFKAFTTYNPLAVLLAGPRDLIVKGYFTAPFEYLAFSSLSLLMFFVSWRLFHLAEIRITERIGAR